MAILLRVKSLKLLTGKPVAIIHEKTAKALAVYAGERIRIKNKHSTVAIVDTAKSILKENEIYLSSEVMGSLNVQENYAVSVFSEPPPSSTKFILEKLNGKKLDKEKIFAIIGDIVHNTLTESEIAYFVSGVYVHGMNDREIADLTKAMVFYGKTLKLNKAVYDKHCIGGIAGNRTTPLIISICSALGLTMPKTSSKAITSAAGTADVMEVFSKIEFSTDEIKKIIKKTNACLVWGGALGLAPADDKIIQVERLLSLDPESQLISSILSKKLSVNASGVLLDIPYGESAKVKTKKQAILLSKKFEKIASLLKLNLKIVLTDGSQPIGNGIGPVLEAIDLIKVLKQKSDRPLDLEKKSVFLAGQILEMSGKAKKGFGQELAEKILKSGRALQQFIKIIEAQGGNPNIFDKLKPAKLNFTVKSEKFGKIKSINSKKLSDIAKSAGCPSDKDTGILLYHHLNDKVEKGTLLLTIYADTKDKLKFALKLYDELKPVLIA